eukprot:3145006-Alexandrium_andersonii.AAC.1
MYPDTSRFAETIERALNDFYGRRVRGVLHADGARENRRAALDLVQPMATSIPGRHETNAIAERTVQSLSACVRVLLEQS